MRPPTIPSCLLFAATLLAAAALSSPAARAEPPPPPTRPGDARGGVERMLPESARADLAFLLHLGWRIEAQAGVTDVRVVPGRPCSRDDLSSARAAGDLRIVLPSPTTAEHARRLASLLPDLVDSIGSRCAWQLRVHEATRRATSRLTANQERGRYLFPPFLVLFDSPWWELAPPRPDWVMKGDAFVPVGTPSQGIEAFYEKECQAECYVAQLISIYAIQRELYGDAAFDRAFRSDELVIGRPDVYFESPIGAHAVFQRPYPWRALLIPPEDQGKDPGTILAVHGPKAFTGLTGIVKDQKPSELSNENFTIVSVTPRANEALRTGGFSRIAALATEALAAYETSRAYLAHGPTVKEAKQRIEELFRDPLLAEVMVYTHPYGVVPIGHLVRTKLKRKLAAMEVWLYSNGREDMLYRRYRDAFAKGFLR